MIEALESFNRELFLSLNATPETSAFLLKAAKFIATDFSLFIPLLLAVLWLWGGDARRSKALQAALAMALGLGLNLVIHHFFYHPRPLALPLGNTYLDHALDASFPSDHTTAFAAVGFVLLCGDTVLLGWITLVLALLVGWSRVFLGVHFPLDILGSFVVSFAASWAACRLWGWIGAPVTGIVSKIYRTIFAPAIARGWVRK